MKLRARLVVLLSLVATVALAQDESRFQLATRLYAQGNKQEALTELNAIVKTTPRAAVWMNISIIEAELGRPEVSVQAADAALSQPAGLTEKQLDRLKVLRGLQVLKLGQVVVTSTVDGTEVWLDGVALGKTPLAQPALARAGTAFLMAIAPKAEPIYRELMVPPEAPLEVKLEPTPAAAAPAIVRLTTSTPDANIYIDDQLIGVTARPATYALHVLPGTRKISLRRDGYLDAESLPTLEPGSTLELTLDPVARQNATFGQLRVVSSEGNVDLTVDGQNRGIVVDEKYVDLVNGRHHLLLERSGFLPIARDVSLPPAAVTKVDLVFEPTAERRAALASGRSVQRVLGFIGIGVGAAGLIGTSIYALGWLPFLDRYWKKQIDDADAQLRANKGCAVTMNPAWLTCDQIVSLSTEKRREIARDQSFGLIGLAVSAAAIGAGVLSLVTAPDPARYERPIGNPDFIRELVVTPLPGGAAVSLGGQF